MMEAGSRVRRVLSASPFLIIALCCYKVMDIDKMIVLFQLPLQKGTIEWEGGSLPILPQFYHIGFLDDLWRGTTVTFSSSTLGYDAIGWWQMFSFLNDLGPVYAIWLLEAYRTEYERTPAYFPSLFTSAGQLLGLGSVAPIFYFLCYSFGPTPSSLSKSAAIRSATPLLPLVLLFHTIPLFGAYLSPTLTARHRWTWAWQMAPVWIGISNLILSTAIKPVPARKPAKSSNGISIASPQIIVATLGIISASSWVYTLTMSPYSLIDVFIPDPAVQVVLAPHMRRALQVDEITVFGSSFLWLLYLFSDLRAAGLVDGGWYKLALLPVLALCVGPGAALAVGWLWRESILAGESEMKAQ